MPNWLNDATWIRMNNLGFWDFKYRFTGNDEFSRLSGGRYFLLIVFIFNHMHPKVSASCPICHPKRVLKWKSRRLPMRSIHNIPFLLFVVSRLPHIWLPNFLWSSHSISCPVLSCPVLSCPVLSCPVRSCPILSCPVPSDPVISCPVPSRPILSYPVLSCPSLSLFWASSFHVSQ